MHLTLQLRLTIIYKEKMFYYNKMTIFLMCTMLIFGMLSSLVNSDLKSLLRIFALFVLFISMNIVIPSLFKENTKKIVTISVLLTHIPLIVLPIIQDGGINGSPYFGMFANPNSVAGVAVSVLMIITALLCYQLESFFYGRKTSKSLMIFNIITISGLLIIISNSHSRTSFLAAVVILIFGSILVFITLIRYGKFGNVIVKGLFSLPIIVTLYFSLNKILSIEETVGNTILDKFSSKSSDMLSGRTKIWGQTLVDTRFFGNGSEAFYDKIGLGSHNTFIEFLGVFGWIPFITFIMVITIFIYYTIKNFRESSSKYKYIPPLVIVSFIALSTAEDMNWTVSMIALLILAGYNSNNSVLHVTK